MKRPVYMTSLNTSSVTTDSSIAKYFDLSSLLYILRAPSEFFCISFPPEVHKPFVLPSHPLLHFQQLICSILLQNAIKVRSRTVSLIQRCQFFCAAS